MPSDSFCLAAQTRLDSKWLKTDIQVGFDMLFSWCVPASIFKFLVKAFYGISNRMRIGSRILEKQVCFL